jgi:NADPH:quinone reductase-like Zn-dependent oxidoreductase
VKAAWHDLYGGPDVVDVRDVEKPMPTSDQVLVRVHAASVNRADLDGLTARWAFIRLFAGFRRPKIHLLGLDVCGVVEAVGEDVTRFKVGDRVFADLFSFGSGAFAEYACAPERAFALIPDGLLFEDAATLPHSAVLALQGLRLRNGRTVGETDRVLVVGASGNVGPFVVQMAKSRGAHVTAVVSTDKLDFARSLGADEVIDYRTTDYTRTGQRYDWIVDVDAHHPLRRWRSSLRPRGVYMAMGGSTAWMLSLLVWQPLFKLATNKTMGLMLHWKPFAPDDVAEVKRLVAEGKVKPVIDRRFPLEEAADALRYVYEGKARGKVIVTS